MPERTLPIRYHLEIYESSFVNDPSATFSANTPFMAFHVGDLLDPRSFNTLEVPSGHWVKVTSIVHRVWEIENSHIGHQVGITVIATPTPQ